MSLKGKILNRTIPALRNPRFRNLGLDRPICDFEIFGFEMQESSDFKFSLRDLFQADQILVRFTPADNLISLSRHQDLSYAGPRIVIG